VTPATVEIRCPPEAWEDVEEGVDALLESWNASVGAPLTRGQAVATVIVVKTTFDVLAPEDGELGEIVVAQGDTFGREALLGMIHVARGA
jgi:pyruvate/2-oxoglutarate dehydrogenase complex dihydrolipoamide acyltransferase (E2) component